MKKQFLLFYFMLFSLLVKAYNFSDRNEYGQLIYYNYYEVVELEVTYYGGGNNQYKGNIKIPESVECYERNSTTGIWAYKTRVVTRIGNSAFRQCNYLYSVSFPRTILFIGVKAFCACPELTSIELPASLRSIEDEAFESCPAITSVKVYEGLKSIGIAAFAGCSSLTSFVVPNSVENIESVAFSDCTSLTSVTLGSGVTSLGTKTFMGCTSLSTIISYIRTPFPTYAFDETTYTNATLIVPKGTLEVYKAAIGWKNFKNIIENEDTEESILVTANSYNRVYGEANPEFGYTSKGGTLEGTPSIICEATKTSSIGTYPIVIKKGTVTNDNVTYINGILTVTKAPLKITAKNYTIKKGEALPTFEATYEGFKNDETKAVLTKQPTITTTATSASEPGEYEITVSGAEAQNYEISYVNGKLTIELGYTPGDANGDGLVNVTDIVATVNYIMEKPSEGFNKTAADLNGDGEINVTDIVKMVSIIMSGDSQ